MSVRQSGPLTHEIVILVRQNGDYKTFSDVCYRKEFICDEAFISARAGLISERITMGSVYFDDKTLLAFANPDGVMRIPEGYFPFKTRKKYVNYIRDLRCR